MLLSAAALIVGAGATVVGVSAVGALADADLAARAFFVADVLRACRKEMFSIVNTQVFRVQSSFANKARAARRVARPSCTCTF